MAEEERITVRRRRILSWPVVAVLVLLLLAGGLVFGLPLLARPVLERELRATLGVPVAIGALTWNPFKGAISASAVAIGDERERISAKRLSVGADLAALLRGSIAVDRIELDQPSTEIRLDENFRPILGSLLGRAGAETGTSSASPRVAIRELVMRDGRLKVHYPLAEGRSRDTLVEIHRLAATDIDIGQAAAGAALRTAASFDGAIDGAPVRGEAQVLVTGDESRAGLEVTVSGVALSGDVLPLPAAFRTFDGKLEGRAKYSFSGKPARQELDLDLRVSETHLESASGVALAAKTISLPKVRVDLLKQRVDLGAVAVEAPMATVPLDGNVAAPSVAAASPNAASAWSVTSGAIELNRGRLLLQRGESSAAIAVDSAQWEGLKGDRAGALAAKMTVEGGGSLTVEGALAAKPLAAKLEVRLDKVPLVFFTPQVAGLPLAFTEGTLGGVVSLDYDHDKIGQLSGKLAAQRLHTAPPDASRPSEVLAVHSAEVEFTLSPTTPPVLEVASLELLYPYVMIQRHRDGVFPLSSLGAAPEAAPPPREASEKGAPAQVRVRNLVVDSGKLEFIDDTLEPSFWTSLTAVNARVEEMRMPEASIGGFAVSGMQDEISPARMVGMLTSRGLEGRGELQNVQLESLNAYVSPVLGYEITAGGLSSTAMAVPAPPLLESTVDVVLRGIDVRQTGRDVIQEQSGVPLPIALGLIADRSGEIRLTLPFFIDPQARRIELGSIVWQAVRSAIVGALTSPLRLLGSLFGTRGAPHAFAVDPIPFAAGSASLDRAGERRVEQIGRILRAHPSLAIVLLPQITEADIRDVGAGGAAALAAKRNTAVRDALSGSLLGPRLEPDRLMLVEWQPKVGAEATGRPGVYAELQERP